MGLVLCPVAASEHPASGREAKKLGTAASDADQVAPEPVPTGTGAAPFSSRPMVFGRGMDPIVAPVYRRNELAGGAKFSGPAVVEERETTAVIRPGWDVEVGPDGSLIATRNTTRNITRNAT